MDILEESLVLERQGKSVIPFSLGEPDFDPPDCVKEACIRALSENKTKYTHSQGLMELREAIAEHYLNKYRVTVHPDQIIVTEGTSPAFFLLFSTIMERGDEIILPNPHYPCDANFVQFLDGKPVYVPIHEKEGYQWNAEKVFRKISKKTRGIFVTSPSNPTGTVLKEKVLRELCKLNVPIVSDEIYHGLTYEGKEHSILEFTDQAFVFNGFSKAYAMTGFRLGYVIVPDAFIEPIRKLQQSFYISTNSFVQAAGLAVLQKGAAAQRHIRKIFMQRREVILSELAALGMEPAVAPQGAFYVLVDVRKWTNDSYKFAFNLLKQAHVAVTPGIDFGEAGKGYIRFSYANSITNIRQAFKRIKKFLSTSF